MSNSSNIAKNTFYLYVRMFVKMGVDLYASRVILNALGIQDYGIYSVIGGVVALFSFFNSAMTTATERFIAFDIENKDHNRLNKTFNCTFLIHLFVAVLILFFAETIGIWFIKHKLVFPSERIEAVNYVYQFSVLTFLISVLQVPFNALLIVRERMNIYALFSLVEVVLKVAIVLCLLFIGGDKLKLYSALMFSSALLIAILYRIYCRYHFIETKFKLFYDPTYLKALVSYLGWNLFGNIAAVARGQGNNMLLNVFFGITVNAAYGIMLQIQGAVNGFVVNFQTAINPQIYKTYARGDFAELRKLIINGARYTYFLAFLLISPIILNINYILSFWLKAFPQYTNIFTVLCLIAVLIESLSGTLMIAVQATGKVKFYMIILGSFIFLNLPISYVLFKIYHNPVIFLYVYIIISTLSLVFRIFFLRKVMEFSARDFFEKVLVKVVLVSCLSFLVLYYLPLKVDSIFTLCLSSFLAVFINVILIWFLGTDKEHRVKIQTTVSEKFFQKR